MAHGASITSREFQALFEREALSFNSLDEAQAL